MFKYNIKSALKNLLRFKSHTVISLLGLIIGLASVFVITAWTIQELQYDKFHKQAGSIYMVTTDIRDNNGNMNRFPETPPPLAESLKENIPAIENSFHFSYLYGGRSIKTEEKTIKEFGLAADPEFFEVLNFPLLEGNVSSLAYPNTIILTKKFAEKLFPNGEALGKSIIYKKDIILNVAGILKDIPETSSLQFQFVISYAIESEAPDKWWQLSDATFIKIRQDADFDKTKLLAQKVFSSKLKDDQYNLNLIPITKLRYGAPFPFFNAEHGSTQRLVIFICVAILILILACINYINLISSYAIKRTAEVTIRKVNGASRKILIGQYLTESILLSLIAWLFSVILSKTLIHFFQSLLGISILPHYLNLSFLLGFILSFFVVGIISGYYPAFLSSSIVPFKSSIFKNNAQGFQGRMQNAFVLSQFFLSITLTIASLVFIRQTNFLNNYDVGYDAENIVLVYLPTDGTTSYQALKNNLLSDSHIEQVSFAGAAPVNLPSIFTTEGWEWEGLEKGTPTVIYRLFSDHNMLDVFDLSLSKGKFFSDSQRDTNKVVINEILASQLGFTDPIGKIMRRGKHNYEIIGVVKNFHFQHLSNEIQPLLFLYNDTKNRMFVKTSQNTEQSLEVIKKEFAAFFDPPFSYFYVEDSLNEMYSNERKISKAILVFTIITILLSSIGLIGLITFNTQSRMKEIGVRKVLGSKIIEIVLMLNKGIMRWFVIAFFFASIFSWFAMNKWLEGFEYRVRMDWWIFALGAIIISMITAITISWQSWKAATKNPVEALKIS